MTDPFAFFVDMAPRAIPSQYVQTVICEVCGFSESLASPTTSLSSWVKMPLTTASGRVVGPGGDLCDICSAKGRAKSATRSGQIGERDA